MPARRLGIAELIVQLRGREMRRVGGFDGNARFEIILRLAPQSLARAQPAESKQQHAIARIHLQPVLGALDLPYRVAAAAFRIERGERGIPFLRQRLLDDVGRPRVFAQRHPALRSGGGNLGIHLLRRRNFLPALLERALIEPLSLQHLGMRMTPQLIGLDGIEHFAALELIDQRQRFGPTRGLLLRLQLEAQRRRVPVGQGLQRRQRILESPLVKQQVGCSDDAHRDLVRRGALRATEISVARIVAAHLVRRARRHHCAQCRRLADFKRAHGCLLRAPIAPLKKRADSVQERTACAVAAATPAILANLRRQPDSAQNKAQQDIPCDEPGGQQQRQQIERQLDAVRWPHEKRVTCIETQGERQCDREREQAEYPEQPAHMRRA